MTSGSRCSLVEIEHLLPQAATQPPYDSPGQRGPPRSLPEGSSNWHAASWRRRAASAGNSASTFSHSPPLATRCGLHGVCKRPRFTDPLIHLHDLLHHPLKRGWLSTSRWILANARPWATALAVLLL